MPWVKSLKDYPERLAAFEICLSRKSEKDDPAKNDRIQNKERQAF